MHFRLLLFLGLLRFAYIGIHLDINIILRIPPWGEDSETVLYTQIVREVCTRVWLINWLINLFIHFTQPACYWVHLIFVGTLIFGAELDACHTFRDIFRSIYGDNGAKAPVTAARNSTFMLQRHTPTLSFIIPHRLSPGVIKSWLCGRQKQKTIHETFLSARLIIF
jgi:hypothetical protein